jgi:hypothetical protein
MLVGSVDGRGEVAERERGRWGGGGGGGDGGGWIEVGGKEGKEVK